MSPLGGLLACFLCRDLSSSLLCISEKAHYDADSICSALIRLRSFVIIALASDLAAVN
jgi:hypothetical protein